MASWKKVIVSGSAAELSSLSLDTALPVAQGGIGASSLTDKAVLISQDSGTDAVGSLALTTNGSIIVGGTNNYTYQWQGNGVNPTSKDQSGLSAGTYTVTVTDSNGCSEIETYILTEPLSLLIEIDNTVISSVLCHGDSTASIKADIVQASIGPFTFEINGTTYQGIPYSNSANNIAELTYTFTNLVAGV